MQKSLLFITGFFLAAVLLLTSVNFVFAQDAGDYGLSETAKSAGLEKFGKNLPNIVGQVIGTALSMIAVAFFVLMVYGGLLWMTARGNEDQTKKAWDTIIAAVIGIVIVLASYALTNFVFKSVGAREDGPGPQTGDRCTAVGDGFACRDIDTCEISNSFSDDMSINNKRDVCNNRTQSCRLNLCDGPVEVVCCKGR